MKQHTLEDLLKAFHRESTGAWVCVKNIDLQGPQGRIQVVAGQRFEPGKLFMYVDITAWLDAATGQRRSPGH
jgi:hypothetical protein